MLKFWHFALCHRVFFAVLSKGKLQKATFNINLLTAFLNT